ncbi:MAG: hypothetical protein ACREAR_06830 [Nitrosotalea sp.]
MQTQVFASPALLNYTGANQTATSVNTGQISVTTDKTSYNDGDKITISGSVQDYISDTPITVIIANPVGNTVKIDQVALGSDRTFSESVMPTGTLWQAAGTYTVNVTYGSADRTAQTTFQFAGSSVNSIPTSPTPQPISSNSWYPGKGLQQGDYFSYDVCWTDWHNCTPLQMNFWVKSQTNDGNGWNVVLIVVDGSIVQKGNMVIGKITPDPISFDPNISNYTGIYRSTISWLDSFATLDAPKSFNASAWGRTGSVGGKLLVPINQEKITIPSGTFDTWVLGWTSQGGIDNKIWIDPSIPFPVNATVYVDVTTGSPVPDYTLELLKIGNSPTEPDFAKISSNTYVIQPTIVSSTTTNPATPQIPHWVKSLFGLYGQGQVSDADLISALRFLIQSGVIKVS